MEWWHVYLFTRLDSINGLAVAISITLGVLLVVEACFTPIILMELDDEWKPKLKTWNKIAVGVFAAALLACVAIPTQKEAAAIFLLPKLAHSDFAKEAQQIPTDAAKLMRLKLESWIADMEPKKTEKK